MPSIFETARWACHVRGKPALLGVVITAMVGCGGPNKGNIDVRKQLQARDEQIATLKRQHDGDVATIKTLQGSATTVPSLPFERLESLFTVHGIRLG
jgi:hypothetical protein